MRIINYNEFTTVEIDSNVITMKHTLDGGYEFQTKINEIKDIGNDRTLYDHTINYIYDKKNNRKYKSERFINKYSTWVTSYLSELRKEGIIQ